MRDTFKKMLVQNARIPQEILDQMENKKYLSGASIKAGDLVLPCLLIEELSDEGEPVPHRHVTLVFIREEDFDLYEPAYLYDGAMVPTIKYKTNEKAEVGYRSL